MAIYVLSVLQSGNKTFSISAQAAEQQKIFYFHMDYEIIDIRNVRFVFSFFPSNQNES